MSIESWKAEFYPIPANEVKPADAAAHSAQKWRGYLPENLAKHELSLGVMVDLGWSIGSAEMCALCECFKTRTCYACPLYQIGHGCLKNRGNDSLYGLASEGNKGDIERLIAALEQASEHYTRS